MTSGLKESTKEHGRRAKGNPSASIESKESAINRKQKRKCTRGDACGFRHDENKRGKSTRSSSPAPEPQTQSDGKYSSKGKYLRGRSPSGKRLRRLCKDYISGKCTNSSCDSWHPPVCQSYKTESGCKFCEKFSL